MTTDEKYRSKGTTATKRTVHAIVTIPVKNGGFLHLRYIDPVKGQRFTASMTIVEAEMLLQQLRDQITVLKARMRQDEELQRQSIKDSDDGQGLA